MNILKHKYRLLLLSLYVAILLFQGHQVQAQDIHFSQFVSSPLTLNPALTGNFDGAYRFAGIYRKQWRSVTVPYNTIGISADSRDIGRSKNSGLGINMFYDQAGDSHLSMLQVNLSGALYFPVKRRIKLTDYFVLGLQGGFTQRWIDYSKLRFNSQYLNNPKSGGGSFDPGNPTDENFITDSKFYPNINAGLAYTREINSRNNYTVGLSVFNINTPNQSFTGDFVQLDRRLNIHFNGEYMLKHHIDILPQVLLMRQGTYTELSVGGAAKYILNPNKNRYRAIYGGIYTRALDAAYLLVGMDYNDIYTAISYDINYSRLIPASQMRGALEVSVIYIIRKLPNRRQYRHCPDFM